jgi:hypothetical protein
MTKSDEVPADKRLRSTGSVEADKVLRAANENADYWMRAAHDVETGPAPERLLAAELCRCTDVPGHVHGGRQAGANTHSVVPR